MNLCIDIGNSTTKVGVFDNNILKHFILVENIIKTDEIKQICNRFEIDACIISSTAKSDCEIYNFLQKTVPILVELTEKTKIPIKNCYKTPETLGKDRLAAVAGANFLQPNKDILVIDAGTAITFDFIDANKNYLGGAISPGLSVRFRALNEFTGRLPLVQIAENQSIELIGNDTKTSILSGVVNGIIFEIDSYICALKEKNPSISVFLSGGNADFLSKRLKNSVLIEKSLVLIGLNRILEFNLKNN